MRRADSESGRVRSIVRRRGPRDRPLSPSNW